MRQRALPRAVERLAQAANPQAPEVAQLRRLIADKVKELRATLDAYKAGRSEEALTTVNNDSGQRMMDEIRRVAAAIEQQENVTLAARQSDSALFGTLLKVGAGAALALIGAIGVLLIVLNRRSFEELSAAHDRLVDTNRELLKQIGERQQAESELRQSQKVQAIGQLTGGVAHDFNNMLGVIGGNLELMQRRIKRGDYSIERFMDAALKATERAASLTHRLLAFARRQPLAPQAIDANRLITTMSDLLRSTLGEQIRIETVAAAGLWPTMADPHQLESAILNIAINARDAMPNGGKLTIETGNAYLDEAYCREHAEVAPGQFVMIALTDTGTGMPPDVIARVFDPFFTTKAAGTGTGLGLSQVHGFVKQSNGHINIYSEPGAGTTVKIYLPRLLGEAVETAPRPVPPVRSAGADEVILVVEDDALMRRLTAEALRELGYAVLESESAAAALRVLDERSDIKLLFTDVVMPDVDGKMLADEAVRRRPGLKVLYTTGYTPNAVVHGGVLDPGVQFLTKPFTLEQVGAKIRAILDRKDD